MLIIKENRRPREAFDYYCTPESHVRAGLALVSGTPRTVLDPGAGSGVWGKVARELWPEAGITGVEVQGRFLNVPSRAGYNCWIARNFLEGEARVMFPTVDLVMGNPPYREASDFVERAMELLTFGGQCVYLLRLAFLESRSRAKGLFCRYPPELVSVCASRPPFYDGKGGADAYAFFVWRKSFQGQTRLEWSLTESEARQRVAKVQPPLLVVE